MLIHIGVVAAAHELVEDDHFLVEVNLRESIANHAAHIATAIERAELAGIVFIICRIDILIVKYHIGNHVHGAALHVFGKDIFIGQVKGGVIVIAGYQIGSSRIYRQDTVGFTVNHVLAIVAEEHIVGRDVGADLQLHQGIFGVVGIADFRIILFQRGTVSTDIYRTPDGDRIFFCSRQADGHLLGIGAEFIERCNGVAARVVVEILILSYRSQSGIVSIGIRAVAAAIDVAKDVGVDTHGISSNNIA